MSSLRIKFFSFLFFIYHQNRHWICQYMHKKTPIEVLWHTQEAPTTITTPPKRLVDILTGGHQIDTLNMFSECKQRCANSEKNRMFPFCFYQRRKKPHVCTSQKKITLNIKNTRNRTYIYQKNNTKIFHPSPSLIMTESHIHK